MRKDRSRVQANFGVSRGNKARKEESLGKDDTIECFFSGQTEYFLGMGESVNVLRAQSEIFHIKMYPENAAVIEFQALSEIDGRKCFQSFGS